MSVIQVPIQDAKEGMYLVGIDVSWMKSPFYKHRFLINSPVMIKQLVACGVKVIDVDTDKSTYRFETKEEPRQSVELPRNRELPSASLSKEVGVAKQLQTQSVKQLAETINGVMTGGLLPDVDEMQSIVEQSHDSTLRNAHALLNLFHAADAGKDLASHCFSVMSIALMLGQRMDLSDEELATLGNASLLMDIGWSKLPPELFKNPSCYTEEEYALIRRHVDYSVEILEESGFDPKVIDLISNHHERIDGKGYYKQYSGDEVTLLGQIMSLADHYDSLIRGYYDTPAQIPVTALKTIYLRAQAHGHSMGLVELLIQLVGIYPVSSAVQLNTGEKGVVIKVNWRDPLRPKVRIHYSKQGLNLLKPSEVDLFQSEAGQGLRKVQRVVNPDEPGVDPLGLLRFHP